jgi:hypothetical protein
MTTTNAARSALPARTVFTAAAVLMALPALSALSTLALGATTALAGEVLEDPPIYGAYYDRYEPSFYTGFAPRSTDPRRLHLHVGRGNQLRVTVVLSDTVLRNYARDLLVREDTYDALAQRHRIVPTQNDGLDAFDRTLREVELRRLVHEEDRLTPAELRERNLALLERLNPGRIFRIEMPEGEVVRRWLAGLRPEDRKALSPERQLELLNAMLPARLWITERDAATTQQLRALVQAAPAAGAGEAPPAFTKAFFALFTRVSNGFYPRRNGRLSFVELTAIYPVGTVNEYTSYRDRKIPLYPTPGRRALTTHQRTQTVDHIPTVPVYSYSPWIPYMHVGARMHNAFHTLWWRMDPARTPFIPASWRSAARATHGGKPYKYLWLLSRGPMSHGCTHLGTGHIAELRQLMPAETEKLYDVDAFLNRSYDYDVFDIDGDFTPEVMGVRYFIAFSLRDKQPDQLRVRNERHAYYDWLYGGDLRYDPDGTGRFGAIRDGRFIERKAIEGAPYDGLALYEAAYEPERFQLYTLVDIPFARELRKVGLDHPFQGVEPASLASR